MADNDSVAENMSASNSQASDVDSAGAQASRREPPTIDLDASDVSGDTNKARRGKFGGLLAGVGPWLRSGAEYAKPAAAGAIAALVVSGAIWLVDARPRQAPPAPPAAESTADIAARLARIETRIENPPPSAPAAPNPELVARLSASEQTLQAMREAVTTTRHQLDGVASALAELKAKAGETAPAPSPVDLSPMLARIEALDQALAGMKQQLTERAVAPAPAPERPLRRVVAASLLDVAVRQGLGFASELAAAKSLADRPEALAPLDAFAARGVPSDAVKCRELLGIIPKLRPGPEPVAPDASTTDRFWANAARLVRVRPVGETALDDAATLANQIEAVARRGDLAEAVRLIGKLPEAARAETSGFLDGVKARDAALTASRQFATDALAALDKPTR